MKRRKSAPAVTPAYMAAWSRLFSRSPEEIQAEKQARQPAPPPRPAGSRKAPISAPQATQPGRDRLPYQSDEDSEP